MNAGKRHAARRLYEFGGFRLDPAERIFARHGERIPLAPKAFDTLLILVQHSGRVVKKEELIRTLWPDSFVEENNLNQHISALRRVLSEGESHNPKQGGEASEQAYIETVPKLGYRFVCRVQEIAGEEFAPFNDGEGEVVISRRRRTRIVLREEIVEEDDGEEADAATQVASANSSRSTVAAPAHDGWLGRHAWATILALAIAGASIFAWILVRREAPPGNVSGNLVRLTFDSGLTTSPALSPDGRMIAYASDRGGKGNLDLWVQPLGGGQALQLTHDSVDNSDPAFSPDGRTIAFRSKRDGGGIYVISVQGGEARLIAAGGRRPKYSPDGNWITYWAGRESRDNTGAFLVPGAGRIYVVAASGGTPREIRPEFAAAGYPIWTPDGHHILFLGNRERNEYNDGTTDWWVTSIDGNDVAETGVREIFRKMGFASVSQVPETWTSDGTDVLISATLADTRNIWRVPISKKDWKAGEAQRLTFGTAMEVQPAIAGSQLVFASQSDRLDVWSVPLPIGQSDRNGDPSRLTDDAFAHTYPAISPDGAKLAYSLQRSGRRDIWIKDLKNGQESAVSIPPWPAFNPNFSPDGKTLMYRTAENHTSVGYAYSLAGGGTQAICSDCSDYGWSSDGRKLVLVGISPARVSILDFATKRKMALLDDPEYRVWNVRFSPDDHWVSFNATHQGRSTIFVAPVRDSEIPRREWIPVANTGWDDKPRWSSDGRTLYFISERDGFRCIWAQQLDEQKRPVGSAIPIFHGHERRLSLSDIGPGDLALSVARDSIVFNMDERTGNLWLASLDARH